MQLHAIKHAQKIKLMAFDVDGVMTDGRLWWNDAGVESKAFHVLDGHGLKTLAASGIVLGIITGRSSAIVAKRAAELGIVHVFQGVSDKVEAMQAMLAQTGFGFEEAGFMGDDLPDLPVLRRVAFAVSVPGAPTIVRDSAQYVTQKEGGMGAVREVCDFILQVQGKYDQSIANYLL